MQFGFKRNADEGLIAPFYVPRSLPIQDLCRNMHAALNVRSSRDADLRSTDR